MEYKRRSITSRVNRIYDIEDMAQECNAYLKTKLFMAKRIAEQQAEIELLKDQMVYHRIKHIQLYDVLKSINEQLEILTQNKKEQEGSSLLTSEGKKINLSGEDAKSFVLEDNKEIINKEVDTKVVRDQEITKEKNKDEVDKNTVIAMLKNENLDLRKELELAKSSNFEKSIRMSKLSSEKFILYTELSELVNSLKKIDMNLLNKFYMCNLIDDHLITENYKNLKSSLSSYDMISSMGIKYNILSAQSELNLMINEIKQEKNDGNYQTDEISPNCMLDLINKTNADSKSLNIDKYTSLIKSYEDELNSFAVQYRNTYLSGSTGFYSKKSASSEY